MSMGPLDVSRPWETRAVVGSLRFLQRLWRNVLSEETGQPTVADDKPAEPTRRILHRTIDAVRTDMAALRFNTAIARLIELNNHLTKTGRTPSEVAGPLVLMLAPFAPHVGEELWRRLGHEDTVTYESFPVADAALLEEDTIEYPVQVNGKLRGHVTVPADASAEEVEAAALADARVAAAVDGATPRRVIVVPGRMVNVVL
jgi:leucyl-tRNA synthetase